MIDSVRQRVLVRSLHGLDRGNPAALWEGGPASTSRPTQDLPTEVDLQKVEQKVLVLERKGLVLFGVCLERHLVDMFV